MKFIKDFILAIQEFINAFLLDMKAIANKNSDISTKRYIDLRVANHCLILSWVLFITLAIQKEYSLATYHIISMLGWSGIRGALAMKRKKDETNS